MSTYILMKVLESAPGRYDRGIRILTLGRLDKAYDRLVSHIKDGQKVLDIGCGTGALALRAARKGATVKGIDINPQMLENARLKAVNEGLTQNLELVEMGAAEIGSEDPASYDAVMSGLCFSELTEDEITYTLHHVKRLLKPGGHLLVADEVRIRNILMRWLYWLGRFPLVIITYLVTQTATHAVRDLPEKVKESGFIIESTRSSTTQDFMELVAKKPE